MLPRRDIPAEISKLSNIQQQFSTSVSRLGLSESEIACDDQHYDNNTDNVKNIHIRFTSLSNFRIIFNQQANFG